MPRLRTDDTVAYPELNGGGKRFTLEAWVLIVERVQDVRLCFEESLLFIHVFDDFSGGFDDVLMLHVIDLLLFVMDLLRS